MTCTIWHSWYKKSLCTCAQALLDQPLSQQVSSHFTSVSILTVCLVAGLDKAHNTALHTCHSFPPFQMSEHYISTTAANFTPNDTPQLATTPDQCKET